MPATSLTAEQRGLINEGEFFTMKVKHLLPVIALSLGTIGVADAADEKWYAGIKGGLMLIDNLDVGIAGVTVDADNGLNGGLFVGYQWGLGSAGSIAAEGEFSTALNIAP